MPAKGSFEVIMSAEPPYDEREGVALARMSFDKSFTGALEATSHVQALSARTPIKGSAAYVAIERISGTLEGREGSFVVAHMGVMRRGADSLVVQIVPDSGTGELTGISGTMTIDIVDGQHLYTVDYDLQR